MEIVKIAPETVWNGLIKIGGILGLMGLVVSIARAINEKTFNKKIEEKLQVIKKDGPPLKEESCCSKIKGYFVVSSERKLMKTERK